MTLKLLSITILIFFVCADNFGQVSKANNSLTLKQQNSKALLSTDTNKKLKTTTQSNDTLRSRLKGIWTNGKTENAVFEIKQNTIYYVDDLATYKYTLFGNKLTIIYPDFSYKCIITFHKDTLIMDSKEYGIASYWKFKK
ncbi:hypothetical protein [Parasediminibacterium sp. JCM 36343]|uniref:hypothetical protein n=1 Tax=Parasediminibacterium sp. JCM 36343 TaxID=3374279 RepID=UPI00397D458D